MHNFFSRVVHNFKKLIANSNNVIHLYLWQMFSRWYYVCMQVSDHFIIVLEVMLKQQQFYY